MSVNDEQIKKIANLAKLQIEESDIPGYAKNLSNILKLVAQMDSVNTDEVTPMAHPLEAVQRLRVDEVTESNQREHFQAHSPKVEDGLFMVPKVIE